jgi:Rrf2 family protein
MARAATRTVDPSPPDPQFGDRATLPGELVLSSTAEYALRAVLHIAAAEPGSAQKLGQIATALDVPRNYLSKTLHQLVRAGVLRSERGPNGGFRLAVPADRLTLAEIVEPFGAMKLARQCLLGRGECSDHTPCSVHAQWKLVADPMRTFFRDTTVASVRQSR